MSLGLFFALAAGGVLLLVGVNRLIGGWSPAQLNTSAAAAARFALDYPEFQSGDIALTVDGRCALISERNSPRLGLLLAAGDTFASRRLGAGALTRLSRRADRLTVAFADFTLPDVTLALPAGTGSAWEDRLRRLMDAPAHA